MMDSAAGIISPTCPRTLARLTWPVAPCLPVESMVPIVAVARCHRPPLWPVRWSATRHTQPHLPHGHPREDPRTLSSRAWAPSTPSLPAFTPACPPTRWSKVTCTKTQGTPQKSQWAYLVIRLTPRPYVTEKILCSISMGFHLSTHRLAGHTTITTTRACARTSNRVSCENLLLNQLRFSAYLIFSIIIIDVKSKPGCDMAELEALHRSVIFIINKPLVTC